MTEKQRPRLHLIDGSGYIFRAYYGIRSLTTSDGTPTNAVVGFARMIGKLLRTEKPEYLGIAFDGPEKTFRHKLYSEYKANRDAPPEDLIPQFALIREFVEALGIPVLATPGFEADDVIATLAKRGQSEGYEVVVVSGDKDLMQLVDDHILMLEPMKDIRYDRDKVTERWGVGPEWVADVQALAGDSSDNIPGIPSVGPKTASKLVQLFGDVEAVIEGVGKMEKRKKAEQNVIDHQESARLSKKLTVLATDVPIDFEPEALLYTKPEAERLVPFLKKIEAFSLLRDLAISAKTSETMQTQMTELSPDVPEDAPEDSPKNAPEDPTPLSPSSPQTEASLIDRSKYQTVLKIEDLDALIDAARSVGTVSVDLETTSIAPTKAEIVGVSLAIEGYAPAYIPLRHRYLGVPKQLGRELVLQKLKPLLEDESIKKIGQNLKYEHTVLARAGIQLQGISEDTMLAAWILDSARTSYSLDSLSREVLGHDTIAYSDVTGKGKNQIGFDEVEIPLATPYAAEDADVALRLAQNFAPKLEDEALVSLYRDIELPLIPILAKMEATGILVDQNRLRSLSTEFARRLGEIEEKAYELIGSRINLASPKQLSHLFFEELHYPVIKKTKTGYSTDHEVLETLAADYELPKVILEHRMLTKLKNTYVDALPKIIHPQTGRIHTSFNQTGTATGRLSSSNPNLQNIPIKGEDGRRIREAFIPEPGFKLVAVDYSQIELRVMAHFANDPSFIEAFEKGEDIHARTAREVLGMGEEVDSELRRQAKAINFGILYGLSEFGLAKQLKISRSDARDYIKNYFSRYPGIKSFMEETIATGKSRGYVETITGRKRLLPELNSRNATRRKGAERVAMNTPIQGSAADLIKIAMINVDKALRNRRLKARLLLQVHDELVLEVPKEEVDEVSKVVKDEMVGVMTLRVPLDVEVGVGDHWADAH